METVAPLAYKRQKLLRDRLVHGDRLLVWGVRESAESLTIELQLNHNLYVCA